MQLSRKQLVPHIPYCSVDTCLIIVQHFNNQNSLSCIWYSLHVDSDAAYLVAQHAKNRIAGYFQLNNKDYPSNPSTFLNGAILVECKTLRHVVASSAENETVAAFHNAQCALSIRYMLIQLGYPQPSTPFHIDNQTITNIIKNHYTKKSKSWNMRFYWLRDQSISNNYQYYWDKSTNNLTDFFTKKYTIQYHVSSKNKYLLHT